MNNNWETKKLSDVCTFINGRAYSKQELLDSGKYPVLRVGNFFTNKNWYYSDLELDEDKYCDKGDLLYAWSASFGPRIWEGEKVIYHYHIWKVIPDEKLITKEFLHLLLDWDTEKIKVAQGTGTTMMHVSKGSMEARLLPIPPLAEQQRIVAILDEAFAAIAQAKENAEKNLQNARELFDSYLQSVFANPGDGWKSVKLSELALDITDGDHMPPPKTETGIPFITISNINKQSRKIDFSDTFTVSKEYYENLKENRKPKINDVLYTVTGSYGIPVLVDEDFEFCFQRHIGLIRPKASTNSKWLYYWILSPQAVKQANDTATGTAQKTVSLKALRNFIVPQIPLTEQQEIVNKLDALSAETKKLENIYRQKINDLDELKKSILQKAFSGELTEKRQVSNVIDFPVRIPNISATDLQAGIVALAFQRHQEKGKVLTFGHVKAEKIVHLAQEVLNIELEREPVKDAAGPNDFPRLIKVESRAEKAGFFKTIRQGHGGYTYIQGNQFDNLIEKTKTALNDKAAELTNLIDLLVPMDTQQAELVATVYAAWNNLLIDNLPITDEAIVFEARENWHEAKLNIERGKFFNALDWIKENNLIPKGKGKKVLVRSAKA